MDEKNIIEKFYEMNKKSLQSGVVRGFLSIKDNEELLELALIEGTEESKKNLDDRFKEFLLKLKVIKYVSSLIHYYTIDFDKRNNRRNSRFGLLLDAPHSNDTEGNPTPIIDLMFSSKSSEDAYYEGMETLGEWIEDEELYRIYNGLTDRQKSVLELIYLKGYSNKEVAEFYNVSPQNISSLHKRAVEKIRSYYKGNNQMG